MAIREEINIKIFSGDKYINITGCRVDRLFNPHYEFTHELINTEPSDIQYIAWLEELTRAYCNGELIAKRFDVLFNSPKEYRTIKCKWTKAGYLRIIGPVQKNKYSKLFHCHTIDEALKKKSVFTISEKIVYDVPKKKEVK